MTNINTEWRPIRRIRGDRASNWKGSSAGKSSKHTWLRANYGRPTQCSNSDCERKSPVFEWCLKTGRKYSHDPNDYLWLCRSCHRRYDLTPKKRRMAIKNLSWSGGKPDTKLSPKDVAVIRKLCKSGIPMTHIARAYTVHPTLIGQIKDNKIWKK